MIATVGGVLGVAAGVAYAWLMLAGLRTWWVAAVSAPFLQLHVTGVSLVIGGLCGVGVSLLAVIWALEKLARRERPTVDERQHSRRESRGSLVSWRQFACRPRVAGRCNCVDRRGVSSTR